MFRTVRLSIIGSLFTLHSATVYVYMVTPDDGQTKRTSELS